MTDTKPTNEERLGPNFRQLEAFIGELRRLGGQLPAKLRGSGQREAFRSDALATAALERNEDYGQVETSLKATMATMRQKIAANVTLWREIGVDGLDSRWNSVSLTPSGALQLRQAGTQESATLELLRVVEPIQSSLSDDEVVDLVAAAIAIVSRWDVQETTFLYWYAPACEAVGFDLLGPPAGFVWSALPKCSSKGAYGPYSPYVTCFLSLVAKLPPDSWEHLVQPGFFAYMSFSDTVDSYSDPVPTNQIKSKDELLAEVTGDRTPLRRMMASAEVMLALLRTDEKVSDAERQGAGNTNQALLQARASRHSCLSIIAHGLDITPDRGKGILAARNAAMAVPNLNFQQGLLTADAAAGIAACDFLNGYAFNTLYRPFNRAIPTVHLVQQAMPPPGAGLRGLFRR